MRALSNGIAWGMAALAILGCGSKSASQPAPVASSSASQGALPPGFDDGGADAGDPDASAPGRNEADEPPSGAFHLVALGNPITIYPMESAAVVDTGAFYALLGDGPLEQDPELFKIAGETSPGGAPRITAAAHFKRFYGSWPDQAWADVSDPGPMKRVNGLFTKQDPTRADETIMDLVPWDDKRAIAAISMPGSDIRFALAGSSGGVVVPAPGKPTATQEACKVRMNATSIVRLAGLPTGHLFAIGTECTSNKPIAERWQPKSVRGETAVIEGVSGDAVAIAAAAPDEAYALFRAGADAYIATWDGKTWKGERSVFGVGKALFVSGDGTAWALGEAGLFKHPKGGAWSRMDTGALKPSSAWAKDQKTVWLAAGDRLFRTDAPSPPVKLPPRADVETVLSRDKRWPASPVCKRPYVLLGTIDKSGDKVPTTYPALTKAVAGEPELTTPDISYVVEDVAGTYEAGAKVPSMATAKMLAAVFKAKNEKAQPAVYCYAPALVKGALKVQ
jgi:hypothetical protein